MLENNIIIATKNQNKEFFSVLSKEKTQILIENLNDKDVIDFLKKFEIDINILKSNFDEENFMTYPLIFIDFDEKKVVSSYSEMDYAFEECCPKNFEGKYENVLNFISKELKYWK